MRSYILLAAIVLVVGVAGFPQEKKEAQKEPAEFKIPPEEAKRENPVKPTAASVSQGKHLYSSQCTMCHGVNGDGKGDLAVEIKLKMKDYRDPAALRDMTDGELYYIFNKGKGQMPDQGNRFTTEQKWNLINYIRSLARKEAPPALKQ